MRATRVAVLAGAMTALVACGKGGAAVPPKIGAARPPAAAGPKVERARENGWGKVYERSCRGSMTTPSVDPGGRVFEYCGALFDVAQGHFRGNAAFGVVTLVSEAQALRDTYTNDLRLSGVAASAGDSAVVPASKVEAIAVAPDGARFVTLEATTRAAESMLVVRELPSLRVVRRTPVSSNQVSSHPAVGFLADGREVVFAVPTCAKTTCGAATLHAVSDRRLVALSSVFDNARALQVAPSGDRAALVTAQGARVVVALPSGKMLYELGAAPPSGEKEYDDVIAVDPDGKTVAVAGPAGLEIYAREGDQVRREHHVPGFHPEWLRFTPEGRTLFAGEHVSVSALRRGAVDRVLPSPAYAPPLPRGVLAAKRVPGEHDSFELGDASMGMPDLIAWYRTFNRDVQIAAFASDATEFSDARDPDSWGHKIADRYYGDVISAKMRESDLLEFHAWEDKRHQRSAELGVRFSGGCDPTDTYVRAVEREGVLYRVEIQVAPETPLSEVMPWKLAFFDNPLGDPPNKRPPMALLPSVKKRSRPSPC